MNINSLYIKKYKNIEETTINLNNLTSNIFVVVGKNGSGKSNLLEAISLIFSNLYRNPQKSEISYSLLYEIDKKVIEIEFIDSLICKVDKNLRGHKYLTDNNLLPTNVIAVYSGEELRMWEKIYKPFYDEYINGIILGDRSINNTSMMYINKYYWNIGLLVLLLSDISDNKVFVENELNVKYINGVKFEYNESNILRNKDSVLSLIINSLKKQEVHSINGLKNLLKGILYGSDDIYLNDREVFSLFTKAYMPKDFKLITNIEIVFNDVLTVKDLSEGEKKRLLMKLVLSILSDNNSIVLFDEPDSFLHPSWQKSLTNEIRDLINGQSVFLTTHSPNVISSVNKENVFYMYDGKISNNIISTYGRDINSIQAEIFGENFRDNKIQMELQEIYDLISRGDLDEAEDLTNKLADEKMGHSDLEIGKLKAMIDFEREFR